MKRRFKILLILSSAICLAGCGIYTFSGTSIQPDVESITVVNIENRAMQVNPTLANDLTIALQDSASPGTAAHQAPLSTGFSRQEHWSGLAFPSPGAPLLSDPSESVSFLPQSFPSYRKTCECNSVAFGVWLLSLLICI